MEIVGLFGKNYKNHLDKRNNLLTTFQKKRKGETKEKLERWVQRTFNARSVSYDNPK